MSDNAFTPVDLPEPEPAFQAISPEQLAIIQSAPPPKRGGKSKKERLWGERTLPNWWQLPTHGDTCDYCGHSHMCTDTEDDKVLCRRCYLVSNDKLPVEERIVHEPPPDKS